METNKYQIIKKSENNSFRTSDMNIPPLTTPSDIHNITIVNLVRIVSRV